MRSCEARLPPNPDPMQIGARLFSGSCTTCHMANGAGTPDGHFPSLFHNSAVGRRNPANLLAVLLNGVQRTTADRNVFMPGFDGSAGMPGGLSDPELATLANFVLTQFGDPDSAKLTAAGHRRRARGTVRAGEELGGTSRSSTQLGSAPIGA